MENTKLKINPHSRFDHSLILGPWSLKIFLFSILLFFYFLLPLSVSASVLNRAPNNLGLVGYWPMDEGVGTQAGDASGNRNAGTITGATWTNGKYGKALSFDGSSGTMVDNGNGTSLNLSNNGTVSVWVKYNTQSWWSVVLNKYNPDLDINGYSISISPLNELCISLANATNDDTACTTLSYDDGKWHNFVGTWDGSFIKIYVDGRAIGSPVVQNYIPISNLYNLYFGNNQNNDFRYVGSLDDVRIYNRALSATEISKLYSSGGTKVNSTQNNKLTNGLVGLWSFNGADINWGTNIAYDRSGQGNNGTLINMSTTTSPAIGKLGQALDFKNTGSVDAGGTNTYNITTGGLTISAWIKLNSVPNSYLAVASKDSPGGESYWCGVSSGTNRLQFETTSNGSAQVQTYGTQSLVANKWYHLVCQWDGSYLRLYQDGLPVGTPTAFARPIFSNTSSHLMIGKSLLFGNQFPGVIDELRIYNRALSATEISKLYSSGGTKVNSTQNNKLTNGLVGLWSFNGADINWGTNIAYDRSGQGNNGTLINMSTTTSPAIGKLGQALRFSNSYVDMGEPASLRLGGSWTVSEWFKPSSIPGSGNYYANVVKTASSNATNYGIGLFNGIFTASPGWTVWFNPIGDSVDAHFETTVIPNTWYHLTGVWDSTGQILYLYLNGVEVNKNTTPVGSPEAGPGSSFVIGYDNCCNDGYSHGTIDEVRIYNRALSADEVKQLYLMGK